MRSFLGFVVLVVLLISVFAFAVVPLAGPGLVSAVVRGTPPLRGQDVTVTARVGPADLLRGEIGRIEIAGNVRIDSTMAAELTVSIDDLSVLDRSFGNLDGQAAAVVVNQPDGTSLELQDFQVSGDSESLIASGEIAADEVVRLLTVRLAVTGVPVDAVRLGSDVVVLTIQGQEIESRLSIAGDSVLLTPANGPPQVVVSGTAIDPWRLIALDVTPAGITVQARLTGARLG
ncbi:MAG TPA: hypothetical protein VEX41_07165 [Candidatus Eisenbacteria bacterium]|nr:hypothetical protein [Candidatus Eisenbacteria bacterium]